MSAFEYAMVLISIVVGLGITHILSSLGSAVPGPRHRRSRIPPRDGSRRVPALTKAGGSGSTETPAMPGGRFTVTPAISGS